MSHIANSSGIATAPLNGVLLVEVAQQIVTQHCISLRNPFCLRLSLQSDVCTFEAVRAAWIFFVRNRTVAVRKLAGSMNHCCMLRMPHLDCLKVMLVQQT